jgi:ketosteroid isomerase-like protein
MNEPAKSVAHTFVDTINRHDVNALAELMTAEHRFIDALGCVVEGREKMRAAWTAYFRMVPDYTLAIDESLSDGPVVAMLGSAGGTFTKDGELKPENRWKTPAAIRAFIENGKVAEWRVYADNEPMRKIMEKNG